MNKRKEKLTTEQMAAIADAERQGKVSEKEMTELVKNTLEQFLLGEFELDYERYDSIFYRMHNGQTFMISVMDFNELQKLKKKSWAKIVKLIEETEKGIDDEE